VERRFSPSTASPHFCLGPVERPLQSRKLGDVVRRAPQTDRVYPVAAARCRTDGTPPHGRHRGPLDRQARQVIDPGPRLRHRAGGITSAGYTRSTAERLGCRFDVPNRRRAAVGSIAVRNVRGPAAVRLRHLRDYVIGASPSSPTAARDKAGGGSSKTSPATTWMKL